MAPSARMRIDSSSPGHMLGLQSSTPYSERVMRLAWALKCEQKQSVSLPGRRANRQVHPYSVPGNAPDGGCSASLALGETMMMLRSEGDPYPPHS